MRRAFAVVACAALGAVLVVTMSEPIPKLAGNDQWLRRFHTPELTNQRAFGQEFVMNRDALTAIEFRPVRHGSELSGQVNLRLVDITDPRESRVIRDHVLHASEMSRAPTYRFEFTPVGDSAFRKYRFEITADNHTGLALVATKGNRSTSGTLTVNGRSRWADLVFETTVATPTISTWRALWGGRALTGVPGKVLLALLLLNCVAVGYVLWRLSTGSRTPTTAPASSASPTASTATSASTTP